MAYDSKRPEDEIKNKVAAEDCPTGSASFFHGVIAGTGSANSADSA